LSAGQKNIPVIPAILPIPVQTMSGQKTVIDSTIKKILPLSQNPESRTQNPEPRNQNPESRIQNPKPKNLSYLYFFL
jgi:hypothetical protein